MPVIRTTHRGPTADAYFPPESPILNTRRPGLTRAFPPSGASPWPPRWRSFPLGVPVPAQLWVSPPRNVMLFPGDQQLDLTRSNPARDIRGKETDRSAKDKGPEQRSTVAVKRRNVRDGLARLTK